jgi:hypothetical protein
MSDHSVENPTSGASAPVLKGQRGISALPSTLHRNIVALQLALDSEEQAPAHIVVGKRLVRELKVGVDLLVG